MGGVWQALGMVNETFKFTGVDKSISYGTGDGRQDKQVGA